MRKRLLLFFIGTLFLMLAPSYALAQSGKTDDQTITVTGVVTDDTGEPLIGAIVKVKGSAKGVSTDLTGKYTITVPRNSMLVYSYVGQDSKELRAKSTTINVQLNSSEVALDQVVVTGYTQTDIRKSTGSVGIVSGKDLKDSPLKNVDMASSGQDGRCQCQRYVRSSWRVCQGACAWYQFHHRQ